MQLPNAPFKILALAPFTLDASTPWSGPPLKVDRHSLDDAMQAMSITANLPMDGSLCPAKGLDLRFDTFKSLHPDAMVKNCVYLSHLAKARAFIQQATGQGKSAASIMDQLHQKWPDLPALHLKDPAPAPRREGSSDALDNLLNMVALPVDGAVPKAPDDDGTEQISVLLDTILRTIFQWPSFRRMEAAWRGLRLLLQQGAVESNVAVEIVPVHQDTLEETLDAVTPLVMEQMPSLVLLDIPFDNSPLAMERLATTARWASTLMAPVLAWVPSSFFQIEKWENLSSLSYLPNHTAQDAYAKYQKLRQSGDGNWISLTCNRFLIRFPYGSDNPPRHVAFKESTPPWVSPVWAVGTLIAQSVRLTGWPTHFTHREKFTIQDLGLYSPPGIPPMAVESPFDIDRRDQMIRSGITPLASQRDTVFLPGATCISGVSMAYQMLVVELSRFLLWCKDNLPSDNSPAALETQLRLAFQILSEQSRPAALQSVSINVGHINEAGQMPLRIVIIPAAGTLPSQQPVEMTINW